jgi:flagellar hook-basal body complex protein FliE
MSAIRIDSLGASPLGNVESSREALGPLETQKNEEIAGLDFGKMLDVVSAQANVASEKSEAFARGALDDIHGTMIAMKEAEISLKLVGTVRNKILDAFQELWRTNV